MKQGKIIRIVSNQYMILTNEGKQLPSLAMGKLRKGVSPVVGDNVLYDVEDDRGLIQEVLPRKNYLVRPLIANIDQAVVVMSMVKPNFSYTLVDQLIFLICCQNIEPVLLITKVDLVEDKNEIAQIVTEYESSGYQVFTTGKNDSKETITKIMKDKITVLTGQSGVGKSSLLNRIDSSFELQTQEISKALGRGKHTTRHVQLYEVAGGWIADTPGFSLLDFSNIDSSVLRESIIDFHKAGECRFRDCSHVNEPGCKVKELVSLGQISKVRYENYLQVLPMCDQVKEWEK